MSIGQGEFNYTMPKPLSASNVWGTERYAILCGPSYRPNPDSEYDSQAIVDQIEESGAEAVIPPRKCRKEQRLYDKHLYKARHLVENAFLRLKEWRGIATRYAKRASSFLTAVHIRCIFYWLTVL